MKKFFATLMFSLWAQAAVAAINCNLPVNLQNGTTADATQVMANFNSLATCFTSAAQAGNNTDITSLGALSTPITPIQGGSTIYYGGTSTGSANAQIIASVTPTGFSLAAPKRVLFIAGFTNNGATQINVAGTGLVNLDRYTNLGPLPLIGGEVVAGNYIEATFDGTEFVLYTNAAPPVSSSFLQGYLSGLILSTAGGSSTFGVTTGEATDSTNAGTMLLASAFTKTTASFAIGTGLGCLDSASIANSTWYHAFLIERTDTAATDILCSTSATSPVMPSPYTLFRRIGSMVTDGSAHWRFFHQLGSQFLWDIPQQDISANNPGTAAVLRTLTVPLGVQTNALVGISSVATNDGRGIVTSPDQADTAPAAGNFNFGATYSGVAASLVVANQATVRTNLSSQIRTRNNASDINNTLSISTLGWIDDRGK